MYKYIYVYIYIYIYINVLTNPLLSQQFMGILNVAGIHGTLYWVWQCDLPGKV